MRKILTVLLVLSILFGAVSCTANQDKSNAEGDESESEANGSDKEDNELENKHMLDGKKIIFIGDSFVYYGQVVLNGSASRYNDKGYFYQLCKSMGAEVITTIDSPEKAEFVKKLGADYVLDYRTEDVRKVIEEHNPTVALDCIGGKLMGDCFKNMVFGGRWIMIATMAGAETTINLETVWRKRIRLIGSTLRSRTSEEKCRIMQALYNDIFPLFTAGKLITNIHAVFPIQEVEAAHGVLRRAENIGKVVLTFK